MMTGFYVIRQARTKIVGSRSMTWAAAKAEETAWQDGIGPAAVVRATPAIARAVRAGDQDTLRTLLAVGRAMQVTGKFYGPGRYVPDDDDHQILTAGHAAALAAYGPDDPQTGLLDSALRKAIGRRRAAQSAITRRQRPAASGYKVPASDHAWSYDIATGRTCCEYPAMAHEPAGDRR